MPDAFDDILPETGGIPAAPASEPAGKTAGGDAFSDILPETGGELPEPPQPSGFDAFLKGLAGNAKAFGANVEKGFAELADEVGNLSNYLYRNTGENPFVPPEYQLLPGHPGAFGILGPAFKGFDLASRAANKLAGRPETAPMNLAGAVDDFYHANELKQRYPLAGTLGGMAGTALFPGIGELGGGWQSPMARAAASGAMAGGVYGGLDSASEDIQAGKNVDPWKAVGSAAGGAVLGAPLSMLLHGGVSMVAKGFQPKITPESRRIERKPIITPGPSEQAQRRALEGSYAPEEPVDVEAIEITPESHRIPKRLYTPPPRQYMHQEALEGQHGHLEVISPKTNKPKIRMSLEHARTGLHEPGKPNQHAELGWRNERVQRSRPATAEERLAVKGLTVRKKLLDRAAAKLESAIQQIASELKVNLPKGRPNLSPAQREELERIRQELGAQPNYTNYYVETAQKNRAKSTYKFKGAGLKAKLAEVRDLHWKYLKAKAEYDKVRTSPQLGEQLPTDETIERNGVEVTKRYNVRNYEFPTPENKAAYEQRKSEMLKRAPRESGATPKGLLQAVESDPEVKAQMEHYGLLEWFKEIASGGGYVHGNPLAVVIYQIGVTAKHLSGALRQKGINISPAQIFAKTLHNIKVNGLEKELTPRFAQRLTMTQTTSDVIRHYDPDFAYKRDAYLAAREIKTAGGRELTHEERELIKGMTSDEIRVSPKLKGWTSLERDKEADAKALDNAYEKLLKRRIKELDDAGVQPGALGMHRLRAMLEHDLRDLKGERPTGSWLQQAAGKAIRKATTGEYVSTFNGNHRVGLLHLGEALVANGSLDPVATARAARKLLRNRTAQRFSSLMAGKGMQAKLTDGEKFALSAWVDKHINNPIQQKMEQTKVGKKIHQIMSAEIEERMKTQLTAVVHAQRVADDLKYPGGVDQLMSDWVAATEGRQVPSSRQTLFTKAQVDMFIARNKAIMHMPEGPLKERTVFQRHGSLVASAFPFLRNVVQQTRVLTSYVDDLAEAASKKNKPAMAKAAGRIIAFHLLVSLVAGKYTLPDYIWEAMDEVDHRKTEQLKKAFDTASSLGARRDEKFGSKYFPVLEGGNMFMMETGQDIMNTVRGMHSDNPKHMLHAAAAALSAGIIDNIGHMEGTNNLELLADRLMDGLKGRKKLSVYSKPNLLERATGAKAEKQYEGSRKYSVLQGFEDWLLGGQDREEAKVHNRIDRINSFAKRMSR